jgi:hypothetical protein
VTYVQYPVSEREHRVGSLWSPLAPRVLYAGNKLELSCYELHKSKLCNEFLERRGAREPISVSDPEINVV